MIDRKVHQVENIYLFIERKTFTANWCREIFKMPRSVSNKKKSSGGGMMSRQASRTGIQ